MCKNYIFLEYCNDPTPVNGQVNATKSPITAKYYYVDTNVVFRCYSGYNLIGNNFSSCNTDGSWIPSPPKCIQGNITN